ncbi:hemerythrin domain-containing protein [Caenispirillum salinarum]|uniref:hemerythrin domain-containing protein n=1 Tax=Caenispirillum salinarum TaxID=859058 RepID=UPI0038511421
MSEALRIIKQEHRNLFRVVHLMEQMVRDQKEPDRAFLRHIIEYIETFTDRYHHPKEDLFLFKALRARDPAAEAILEELEAEHDNCPVSLTTLKTALDRWDTEGTAEAKAAFEDQVQQYLRFQMKHMQKEEGIVMPMAQRCLTPEDWAPIDAAFRDNDDPIFGPGARAEVRGMYSKLVSEAPAPYGIGD